MDLTEHRIQQFRDAFQLMELDGKVSFERQETTWGDRYYHIFYRSDETRGDEEATLVISIFEEN